MLLRIKEWFYYKTSEVAEGYNTFIDVTEYSRVDGVLTADKDGYVEVIVREVLNETEKAIQVILDSGSVVGNVKGWKTWIPKSVIAK
jgi:hypothetical protein